MLVLSVKRGDSVVIKTEKGDLILLKLLNTTLGNAKIGFDADKSIYIDKESRAIEDGIIPSKGLE